MKIAYAAVICILAFLFSACVTGDEISSDKRSALLDADTLDKMIDKWEVPSITLLLEWQVPEVP